SRLGNGKTKSTPLAWSRFYPDAAAVALDNALAERQTDAGAGVFVARVQALKKHEDALKVFRCDADAVVPDGEQPLVVLLLGANLQLRRALGAELDGVGDRVLEQAHQLAAIGRTR